LPHPLKEILPTIDPEKLKSLEQTQQEIKKTLEKHSLLLDFISLASQQQSHQQTQPDPLEPVINQVAEQQNSLQSQLTELAALISQNEAQQHSQRMPEEFKLQLEKQKIEMHKLISQSLAQALAKSSENLKDEQHEALDQLEKRFETYHQAAQQSLEKNMGALASGMSELKTLIQAVQKKQLKKSPHEASRLTVTVTVGVS
jgi:DNA repair exonuclease SbcCD ATPase subunit